MSKSINVKVDFSGVSNKISSENFKRGQYAMANQMLADMNKFVPKLEGDLRAMSHVSANGSSLVWESVYAHRQYLGIGITHYTTPNTGSHWDKRAQGIYTGDWEKAFKKGAQL